MRAPWCSWLCLLVATSSATADPLNDAPQLSLAELFQVAVRAAPELQSSAFDAALAGAQYEASLAVEDWTVLLGSSVRRIKGSPTELRPTSTESLSINAAASLRRVLPTNGTIELVGQLSSLRVDAMGVPDTNTPAVTLRVSQPLLANSGSTVQKAAIRQARHQHSAERIRRMAVAREFVGTVVEAYWQLALAWQQLDVRRNSFEAAKKQLAAIERGLKSGALAKSEQIPFDQAIAAGQIGMLSAEQEIVARSIELRRLVGLEISADQLALRPAPLPAIERGSIDVKAVVARALEVSDELKAATEELRGAEVAMEAARRNLLPRLDLTLEGGPVGAGASTREAIDALLGAKGYQVATSLQLELPIGRHGAKGEHAGRRATLARARFDLHARREMIAAEVARLAYEAKTNQLALELGEKEVSLAQANVEAEQRKFELGRSTANEIVRRQTELEAARLKLATTAAAYAIARARLDAATGDILPRYGIQMLEPGRTVERDLQRR